MIFQTATDYDHFLYEREQEDHRPIYGGGEFFKRSLEILTDEEKSQLNDMFEKHPELLDNNTL